MHVEMMDAAIHAGHVIQGMNAISEHVNMTCVQQTRVPCRRRMRDPFFAQRENLVIPMPTA